MKIKPEPERLPRRAISGRKVSQKKMKRVGALNVRMEAVLDKLRICHCRGIYGKGEQIFTDEFSRQMNCLLDLLKEASASKNSKKLITASQMKSALIWTSTALQSLGCTDDQFTTVGNMIEQFKDQGVW
jgi:hypothetical protein